MNGEPRQKIDQGGLGPKLRRLRKERGLTLDAMAKRTGYSASALSKMETEQLGLTYDKLTRIAGALDVELGSLFTDGPQIAPQAVGRRSVVRRGEGRNISTGNYDYLYVAPELSHKRIVPILGKVYARSLEEFGPLVRHDGEEWIYVVRGVLEVHSEFYEPEVLAPGDSIYIDSRMGHAYISKTPGGTEIIAVCTDPTMDEPAPAAARPGVRAEAKRGGRAARVRRRR